MERYYNINHLLIATWYEIAKYINDSKFTPTVASSGALTTNQTNSNAAIYYDPVNANNKTLTLTNTGDVTLYLGNNGASVNMNFTIDMSLVKSLTIHVKNGINISGPINFAAVSYTQQLNIYSEGGTIAYSGGGGPNHFQTTNIYVPTGTFDFNGGINIFGVVVANTVDITGNSNLITYAGPSNAVKLVQ